MGKKEKKNKKDKKGDKPPPNQQCITCGAKCCSYFALPIEEPETKGDFDDIRWYLLHEGVSVFVDDDDWYIQIDSTCTALRPDHLCGIYEDRPRICRKYKAKDCEHAEPDGEHDLLLRTPEECLDYAKKVLAKKRKKTKKKKDKGNRK